MLLLMPGLGTSCYPMCMVLKRLLWLGYWFVWFLLFFPIAIITPFVWVACGLNLILIWMDDYEPLCIGERLGVYED